MPEKGWKVITVRDALAIIIRYEATKRHLTDSEFVQLVLEEYLK